MKGCWWVERPGFFFATIPLKKQVIISNDVLPILPYAEVGTTVFGEMKQHLKLRLENQTKLKIRIAFKV